MSGSQHALKVISILVIIVAIISAILGIVAFVYVGSGDPSTQTTAATVEGVTFTAGEGAALIGVMGIISGIVDLFVGIMGVRGANNPAHIGAFWVIALIGVIFEAIELILTIVSMTQGSATWHTLGNAAISLATVGVCFWLANNIKKQGAQA